MDIAQALQEIGNTSLTTDKALLRLGEALTDKLTLTDEAVRRLNHRVAELHNKVKELSERTDILLTMFNTQSN